MSFKKRQLSDILEELDQMRKKIKTALSPSSPSPSHSSSENLEDIEFVEVKENLCELNDPIANNEEVNNSDLEEVDDKADQFKALGAKPTEVDKQGDDLHDEIVVRWKAYLHKGVDLEERQKLTNKYPVPKNCQELLPPKVNDEILGCVPAAVNKDDRLFKSLQYQLGHGLTAIGQVMDSLLKENKSLDKLACLADGALLFANVHNAISVIRRQKITPYLKEPAQKVAKASAMDEMLFGTKFEESLKTEQSLRKTSGEIKRRYTTNPTNFQPTASTSRAFFPLPKPILANNKPTSTTTGHLNYRRGVARSRPRGIRAAANSRRQSQGIQQMTYRNNRS